MKNIPSEDSNTQAAMAKLAQQIGRLIAEHIANEIVGVQPIPKTAGKIFVSPTWVDRVFMTKAHYAHFLKVYNRRKYHRIDYITDIGYRCHRVRMKDTVAVNRWCRNTFKTGTYVRSNSYILFAYERDYMLFLLTWG